jgi:hypothetical protein
MRLIVLLALVCVTVACPKDPPPTVVDAGASIAAAAAEVVVFTGAPGWQGGRGCTDVRPEDNCDSQWLHSTGQLVRVFVVTVKDPAALTMFVDKLAADVATKGGVVDRFTQNGLTLVRFLQAVRGDAIDGGAADDVVTVNYALVGRDQKAVHLITSVVGFDEQQAADARLRELLGFASWTPK